MLGQQYYGKPEYAKFLEENFVLYRAGRGDLTGEAVFKKFGVPSTPFLLFLDGDGNEVDWLYGYSAPPEDFHNKILKVLKGEDTVKSLTAQNAAGPKSVLVMTKLADKLEHRAEYEKAVALRREIIALDPDGKQGMTAFNKKQVSCTEMAEYAIGISACYGQGFPKRTGEPLEAFIAKYPQSPMKKEAYSRLSIHYYPGRTTKEATEQFFNKVFAEYPDDPWIRFSYAQFGVYEEDFNVDRAIEAIEEITSFPTSYYVKTKAELYAKKGDLSRAEAAYGSEYADSLLSSTVGILAEYGAFWIKQKTNLEDAERKLQLAIRLDPIASNARVVLAGYYLGANQPEKALDVYGPGYMKTAGVGSYALTGYARFWVQKKQNMDSAAEALEMSLKPESATSDTLDRFAIESAAALFYQLGKPEKALEVFGPEYIKLRMFDPIALSGYARFWAGKKTNLESALAAAETSVTLKETISLNRGSYWITLSQVYQALGRLEDAKKAVETAIQVSDGLNADYYKSQLKKIQEEIDKKK